MEEDDAMLQEQPQDPEPSFDIVTAEYEEEGLVISYQ